MPGAHTSIAVFGAAIIASVTATAQEDQAPPAPGKKIPSAFAHCDAKWGKYDPKLALCKPQPDMIVKPQ